MRCAFVLLAALLIPAMPARAGFMLNSGKSHYEVGLGGTISVDVYLTESGTSLLQANGLIGAGLLVKFNEQPFAVDPAQVVDIAPNPGVNPGVPDFDFLKTSLTPAGQGAAGSAELDWGLTTDTFFPAPGESSILIGSFNFLAGSVTADVTTLSFGLSGLKFVLGDGTDVDDTFGIATTTSTITTIAQAVPEPASLVLLAIAVIPGLAYRKMSATKGGRRGNSGAMSPNLKY